LPISTSSAPSSTRIRRCPTSFLRARTGSRSAARKHVIGYLEDFLFAPERARSPVSSLSGGERNRLLLARLFAKPANVLVLDEPTNDLDIETLELLEELLQNYDGTLFLVSHDRTFLDNVVTQTIAAEGDGTWHEYAGGYSDWASYKASLAKEAASKAKAEARPVAKPAEAPSQGRQAVVERAARTRGTARQDRRAGGEQAELTRLLEDPAIYQLMRRPRRKRRNGWPPSTMNSCSAGALGNAGVPGRVMRASRAAGGLTSRGALPVRFAGRHRFQPEALAHRFRRDVEQLADGLEVVGQCRIVPAVRGVAGQLTASVTFLTRGCSLLSSSIRSAVVRAGARPAKFELDVLEGETQCVSGIGAAHAGCALSISEWPGRAWGPSTRRESQPGRGAGRQCALLPC
jgi:energy-coupling factor transporter ATP-binding protein EcfA2